MNSYEWEHCRKKIEFWIFMRVNTVAKTWNVNWTNKTKGAIVFLWKHITVDLCKDAMKYDRLYKKQQRSTKTVQVPLLHMGSRAPATCQIWISFSSMRYRHIHSSSTNEKTNSMPSY